MQERTTDPVSNRWKVRADTIILWLPHICRDTATLTHILHVCTHTKENKTSKLICCMVLPLVSNSSTFWLDKTVGHCLSGLCWCFPWNSRSKEGRLVGFQHMQGKKLCSLFRGVSLEQSNKIHLTSHMPDILLLAHLWPLLFYCYVPHTDTGDLCCWHGAASLPVVSSCSVPAAGF